MKRVLKVSYVDVFAITIEYGINVAKYLSHESREVFPIKDADDIDVADVYPARAEMPNGYALLNYKLSSFLSPEYKCDAYELFLGDNARANTEISKTQAMSLIDKCALTLVVENEYGKVWE